MLGIVGRRRLSHSILMGRQAGWLGHRGHAGRENGHRQHPRHGHHAGPWPSFGVPVISGGTVLVPAVLPDCTCLYVAVRKIGATDGLAYVHIVDSVAAANLVQWCLRRSEGI